MLSRRLTPIIILAALSIGCASLAAPTATPVPSTSIPPPNIEATVEARVQAALAAMPTSTPGPMFAPSQAIAIVQQYLGTKTYVRYSGRAQIVQGEYRPQNREVRQCQVIENADWRAGYQNGIWVVIREWERKEGISPGNYAIRPQTDKWSLEEPTRVVKRLGVDANSPARIREC